MAFLDILKGRKREEVKPERLPKGAFSPKVKKRLTDKQRDGKTAKRPVKLLLEQEKEKQKKESKEKNQKTSSKISKPVSSEKTDFAAQILIKPHITERTTSLSQQNVYTFHVSSEANKILIKKAIKAMYGFEPIKIRVINVPSKKRMGRGKTGIKSGFKKALIYLKEGEKIEFI